jgi:hypothetical protein
MKITIIWDVMLHSLLNVYHFIGACCLHLQGSSTLKVTNIYQTTLCHNLHSHCYENTKSYTIINILNNWALHPGIMTQPQSFTFININKKQQWDSSRQNNDTVNSTAFNITYVGSSPMRSLNFFNWPNRSGRTMALGLTQPLTEMSTRN